MNTQRLLQLASFLRKLPPERFAFSQVVEHATPCGTIGCAIGWTPVVFPDLVEWDEKYPDGLKLIDGNDRLWYEGIATRLFGIPYGDAQSLFTPECQTSLGLKRALSTATPSQVADLIEEYIKLKS